MVAVDSLAETLSEQLKTQELVRVAASEEDYLQVAPGFPGKLEYRNGEIIAMSLASFWHEVLVNSIGFLLEQFYRDQPVFVSNSNIGLQLVDRNVGYVQPDLMVIKGTPIFKERSTSIITNPLIVVEVLSKSTSKYDQDDKLPAYKDIDTLQYIVYVAQDRPYVSVWARTPTPNVWLNSDYRRLDEAVQLGDLSLPLTQIYHKITFEPPVPGINP